MGCLSKQASNYMRLRIYTDSMTYGIEPTTGSQLGGLMRRFLQKISRLEIEGWIGKFSSMSRIVVYNLWLKNVQLSVIREYVEENVRILQLADRKNLGVKFIAFRLNDPCNC